MTPSSTQKPKRRGCLLAAIVIALLVGTGVLVSNLRAAHWREPRAFDAAEWNDEADNERGLSSRHAMADAVRAKLLQDRPTREQVFSMLGEPTFTGTSGLEWWTLGMPPGRLRFDGCWLQIRFDSDNRLADVFLDHEER